MLDVDPLSCTYSPPFHLLYRYPLFNPYMSHIHLLFIFQLPYSPLLRFYPMLDVDQLYKILTTEKSLLLAHPQLAGGSNEDDLNKDWDGRVDVFQ